MRVLISHPRYAARTQISVGSEEAGYLGAFWSGVPVVDSNAPRSGVWGLVASRLRAVPIASGKRNYDVIFPLMRKLIGTRPFERVTNDWGHRIDRLYDIWVARRIRALKPDMVVCYENFALHTFKIARAVCVLDVASIHYTSSGASG